MTEESLVHPRAGHESADMSKGIAPVFPLTSVLDGVSG